MHLRRIFLFLLLLASSASVFASVESDFKIAYEAYQKRQTDRLNKAAARIPADHLLHPYVAYWRLKADNATPDELGEFIARYPDTPLADLLHEDLAELYALAGNWPAFRSHFLALYRPSQTLLCYDLNLRLLAGEREAVQEGIKLWRSAKDQPESCGQVFDWLFAQGKLSQEDRYLRLRLALDDGNLRLARALDAQLPVDQRMEANALATAQRHGDDLIRAASPRRAQREAALYALSLFAKLDPEGAARQWEAHAGDYPEAEQQYGWGQIAMHAARKHEPRALAWFLNARGAHSDLQAMWRVRAALRQGKWPEVYHGILAMPAEMQEESVWRYWRARALKVFNAGYQANQIFSRLSQELDYYGLLALEELPPRLETRREDYRITPDDMQLARQHPGLSRALLLRKLGLNTEAMTEWNRALIGMSDAQLLAAAELALRESWHDRAISTAIRTKNDHSMDLRFISPYRDLASAYASENGLDEAWVFGLIRQESRFIAVARSRVGAQGLMQIMPATAKWIAKQLGLDARAASKVGNPDTNIRFGTYYLKRIYEALERSPVLATAGYNAGPGRARRWQADVALEGAIYVENIPFLETRDYVKRVMTNAMFYRARFGGPGMALKDRLGVIPARLNALPPNLDETSPAPD